MGPIARFLPPSKPKKTHLGLWERLARWLKEESPFLSNSMMRGFFHSLRRVTSASARERIFCAFATTLPVCLIVNQR